MCAIKEKRSNKINGQEKYNMDTKIVPGEIKTLRLLGKTNLSGTIDERGTVIPFHRLDIKVLEYVICMLEKQKPDKKEKMDIGTNKKQNDHDAVIKNLRELKNRGGKRLLNTDVALIPFYKQDLQALDYIYDVLIQKLDHI